MRCECGVLVRWPVVICGTIGCMAVPEQVVGTLIDYLGLDEDTMYDWLAWVAEQALKPKLTDEFLETLTQAVRTCGWSLDMVETGRLAEWCYELAGKSAPDALRTPAVES